MKDKEIKFLNRAHTQVGRIRKNQNVQERNEDEQKTNEKWLNLFIENTKAGIVSTTIEGKFIKVNPSFCNFLGYTEAELLKMSVGGITYQEDLEETQKKFIEIKKSFSRYIQLEKRYLRKDGRIVWGRITATLLEEVSSGTKCFISVIQNITECKEAKEELKTKNIALKELLSQIELEKKSLRDNVIANIEKNVMPILQRIKKKGNSLEIKRLEILEKGLREITSSFGLRIQSSWCNLTSRQIEICNMIKNGMSTKEIAEILSVSMRTIDTHRNIIRKKMNISHKRVNLSSYLKSLD